MSRPNYRTAKAMEMDRLANDILPQDLARFAVEGHVEKGVIVASPVEPIGVLAERAGTFVTLRTYGGDLRGCIGTISPTCFNVAEEIIQNAVSAATRDPRFPEVRRSELSLLSYGVNVLSPPEDIPGPEFLDPGVYGVIVETTDHFRRGLLLPNIEGLETVEQQWLAVHQKAGIRLGTAVRVQRFLVRSYGKD